MRRAVAAGAVVVALALAGCGGGSKNFSRSDLPELVLKRGDAPPGTKLNPKSAGRDFLEREGGNADFLRLLRPFGFSGDAGSEFYGKRAGVTYAESLVFLFKDSKGASKALAAMHRAIGQVGQNVREVGGPRLGDEGWAVSGPFAPNAPPGYFFVWRDRNVVRAFTMSGARTAVTLRTAGSYADKLAKR